MFAGVGKNSWPERRRMGARPEYSVGTPHGFRRAVPEPEVQEIHAGGKPSARQGGPLFDMPDRDQVGAAAPAAGAKSTPFPKNRA